MTSKKDLSERDICTKYIQLALEKAGWNPHTQIREEVSFTDGRIYVKGNLTTIGANAKERIISSIINPISPSHLSKPRTGWRPERGKTNKHGAFFYNLVSFLFVIRNSRQSVKPINKVSPIGWANAKTHQPMITQPNKPAIR